MVQASHKLRAVPVSSADAPALPSTGRRRCSRGALSLIVDGGETLKPREWDEAELVSRIFGGSDLLAEDELVRRYSHGLLIMLRQRCGNPDLAADLHQDAFVVVLKRLREKGIEDPSRLKAFLHRTAVNLVIGDYRRTQRRDTHADIERIERCADDAEDAVTRVIKTQAAELVRQLIGELRMPRDRELLERYYLKDEDKQSICVDLSLDTLHFDRVLFRARQRLKALAQKCAEVPELRT